MKISVSPVNGGSEVEILDKVGNAFRHSRWTIPGDPRPLPRVRLVTGIPVVLHMRRWLKLAPVSHPDMHGVNSDCPGRANKLSILLVA